MITTFDLIMKTKFYLDKEPEGPYKTMVEGIVDPYHLWDKVTPLQHTVLAQYCISCDWREEEYKRNKRSAAMAAKRKATVTANQKTNRNRRGARGQYENRNN